MDRLSYYIKEGIKAMNQIEYVTGRLMHEIDLPLETQFWCAADMKNEKELKKIYSNLCKVLDILSSEVGS